MATRVKPGTGGDKAALASAIGDQAKPGLSVKSMPTPENLIPVREGEIGGVKCLVVDARELHQFLGARRDFTNWLKGRCDEYGFINGADYEEKLDSPNLANQVGTRVHGGDRRSKSFILRLDTAKELAMVERTEKGREVRRYFIRCEQDLLAKRESQPPAAPAVTLTSEERDCLGFIRERCLHGAVVEYARSLEIVGKEKPEIAWEMAKGAHDRKMKAIVGLLLKILKTGTGSATLREFIEKGVGEIEAARA